MILFGIETYSLYDFSKDLVLLIYGYGKWSYLLEASEDRCWFDDIARIFEETTSVSILDLN